MIEQINSIKNQNTFKKSLFHGTIFKFSNSKNALKIVDTIKKEVRNYYSNDLESLHLEKDVELISKELISIVSLKIFFPSRNDKFLSSFFMFKACKTFVEAIGIIGLRNNEILAICSSAVCKILFIFSMLVSFNFHGSSSLIYLLVKKLILITDLI